MSATPGFDLGLMKRSSAAASPLQVQYLSTHLRHALTPQYTAFCLLSGQRETSSASPEVQVHTHTYSDTHLEFHLLCLLGVDSHDSLVVPECVSAVFLLCGHVSLQSLQHALWLEGRSKDRMG